MSEAKLTLEQQRAVASGAHALEVRAGAGTGKTTTLAHRLARLAADGTPEHRLLAVTFTREATASLQRRLGALLGKPHAVRVGSFHQWAAREMRDEGPRFLDAKDARAIILRALQRRNPGLAFTFAMGAGRHDDVSSRVLGFLSYARNAECTVGDAILRQFPALAPWQDALEGLADRYEDEKGERLDYDDLLLRFRDRLKRSRAFRGAVAARLDHLAVDEYQDVNRAQADAVRLLASAEHAPRVTVVGDPRQSIYGFRGGSPAHLDTFLKPFGKAGERVALTVSFRATRALVAASNAALPDAYPLRARPRAPAGATPIMRPCAQTHEEAALVADHVQALLAKGAQPADCVVLCRARHLAAAYVEELAARRDDRLREVAVSTIHAAKGLEWDHVAILGAREGGLPSDHALAAEEPQRTALVAEERRLFYVALTRARQSLLVTWPQRGERRAFQPSRFVAPLLEPAAPLVR